MKKKILVLSGSPKQSSFSSHLAEVYAGAAKPHSEVHVLRLSEMLFDMDLKVGYDEPQKLEEVLEVFQHELTWADHVVLFTPIWWGSIPAKLKGLIDRSFLPGFAFQYEEGKDRPLKLLQGKSARVVMTMDTPPWYYQFVQGAPALKQLKIATLEFCGFKPVHHNMLGPIISATDETKSKWIKKISQMGLQAR